MVRRASPLKRLVFTAALLVLVAVAVEGISWAAFWVMDARAFSWSRLAEERALLGAEAPAERGQPEEQRVETSLEAQVLHPYLGFVTDPDSPATHELLERYNRAISEQGFFQPLWAASREVSDDTLVIGIFGGSVATIFAMQSEFLVDALHEQPLFADRDIVVRCFATPGHSQPQQLLTLAYLLAQDERLDLVLNIDGFNEIVLPLINNLRHGVHPLYPMDWARRVRDVPDPHHRRLVGELAYIRDLRKQRAVAMSVSWRRFSVTSNLLWRAADRRLAGRQASVEEELEAYAGELSGFLVHGPRWAPRSEPETDRYLAGVWQRASLQMDHLCDAAGIRYFHLLQPNQYVQGSKPMTAEERRVAIDLDHPYRPQVGKGYKLLVAAGAELRADGVDFVDLSMVFSEVQEPLYIDACCHFGWKGNRILAAAIAEAAAATAAGP